MDPKDLNGATPIEPSAPAQGSVPEVEFNGEKYKIEDLVTSHKAYTQMPQEDVQNLGRFKSEASEYSFLMSLVQSDANLQKGLRDAYARASGKPVEEQVVTPPAGAPPAGAIPKEILDRLAKAEGAVGSVTTLQSAVSGMIQRQENESIEATFDFLKGKVETLNEAAVKYAQAQSKRTGQPLDEILNGLSYLPKAQWVPIVMPKEYAEHILKQRGNNGPNPRTDTPAARINNGQPGLTPDMKTQLLKKYGAALASGDNEKAAEIMLEMNKLLQAGGAEPGYSPEMARAASR